jgi:hypothetical protein
VIVESIRDQRCMPVRVSIVPTSKAKAVSRVGVVAYLIRVYSITLLATGSTVSKDSSIEYVEST